MHSYSETRVLPYPPEKVFALVLDIEKYPEFLPWCRAARVLSREKDSFLGELVISFSHLTERYSSRVTPTPPAGNKEGTIEVELIQGPFRFLDNHWRFVPHKEGTELHFAVKFEFKSKMLNMLMGAMFTRASEKMVGAFMDRAQDLYG